MVFTRVRLKNGKGGSRWKKGHSAASNPATSKHRQAVKGSLRSSKIFRKVAGDSLLTEENVTLHGVAAVDDEDKTLYSQSTTSTCYSFIETAHPIFHKVKKLWTSSLESHQEVCAVLAAVSEVVKSSNGKETETEYFAALLSALQSAEEEPSVTAILFLLNVIMPEINSAVLQTKFTEVSKLLLDILMRYERSSCTTLLKSLVSCSLVLLSAQTRSVWAEESTLHFLQVIASYSTDTKPKVRKATHEGLAHMIQLGLRCSDDVIIHPAAMPLAKFCLNQFEQGGTGTLHILNLLKETLAHMPSQLVKRLSEKVLKFMSLGNTLMKSQCLQALHGLFLHSTAPQGLTVTLNGQLISALYDYQPNVSDVQLVGAWAVVMETAHLRIMKFDEGITTLAHLPKLFKVLMRMLMSPSPGTRDIICSSLKSLIEHCLQGNSDSKAVRTCFRSVVAGLSYQYRSVWKHVLQVLGYFYCYLGNSHYSIMSESLRSLCELRNTAGFPCVDQLDKTFSEAITNIGPQKVLESVPLHLDPGSDSCNDWVLLIMRDHVRSAELSYFVNHLLPIAMTLRKQGDELANQNPTKAAMYRTLYTQMWDLLPAFCTSPRDIMQSFNLIARLLGEGLKEQAVLRPIICRSLRLLIDTSSESAEDTAELSRYSKNYLPILFNIYTKDSTTADSKSFILDCLRSYACIADSLLLENSVTKICSRFMDESTTNEMKFRLVELLTVLCGRVGVALLGQLYQTVVCPWVKDEDGSRQKKGYLLLEHLSACSSPALEQFLQDHVHSIQELLLGTTTTVRAASRRLRMKCIHYLVGHVMPLNVDLLRGILPEVILSVKDRKEKTRQLAISVLLDIGHSYDKDLIGEYLQLVVAGLAGSAHMISATILSLIRIVYVFHDLIPDAMVGELVKTVGVLLTSKCKEVVKSSLDFMKVIIGVLDKQEILCHVDSMVGAVFLWDKQFQQHFHFKARVILERLIKKLGYELVEGLVPKQHKKLIVHIHKMVTKQQKKRDQSKVDKGSKILKIHKPSYEELLTDDGMDSSKHHGSWIREDDDPTDLMDPTALHRILASRPVTSKPIQNEFITSEDGKLIVEDIKAEQPVAMESKKRKRKDDNESSMKTERVGSNKKQKVASNPGSQYRSEIALGDMKRSGLPDPYVYIPLNRQSLNKRKQNKLTGRYGALLKGGHSGWYKGRKQFVSRSRKMRCKLKNKSVS